MRKFKIISTCAALMLMVALMAFGVYAATVVKVTVSGTVSFKCTDVYIKVTYGIVGGTTYGPYSSQPGDTLSWKDESGKAVNFSNNTFANKLPDLTFTETADTSMPSCTYFITVENLHGMDIGLSLGYKWANNEATKTTNPITATNKLVKGTTINSANHGTQKPDAANGVIYNASTYSFVKNTTTTLFVTLTLNNENYVAGGNIQMALSAAVNVNEVPEITF